MSVGEDAERQIAIKLPRMSFEIVAISYDQTRQLPKTNYIRKPNSGDGNSSYKYYTPVPYIINFQLNVYAKQQDDALQIVEQILPYFNPQYTVSMKPIDNEPSIIEDTPITLQGISFLDDYEGPMEQRRSIVYTLDFEMKIAFYGPTPTAGSVIKQVDANMHIIMDSDGGINRPLAEIVRVNTIPVNVSVDSDYGFTTKILQYLDDSA
jgi:hypothetical protein